jgi:GT2 family glycosyltransferase
MTGSRRGAAAWGSPPDPDRPFEVEVLIPTRNRPAELAVALAGLAAQDDPSFAVVVSDQSDGEPGWQAPAAAAMVRVLRAQGRPVRLHRHVPVRGLAEHRQFLLDCSQADRILYLDDDVWLEPGTLNRMDTALTELGCGFVGSAVQGLSYLADQRPHECATFEAWDGPVQPETIRRHSPGFARWQLHNAANLVHQAAGVDIPDDGWLAYKVAWVGACVLYRRQALIDCGGFDFWPLLGPHDVGEDVAAQWRVMERYGGAGLLPSGAVHLESPTTVAERRRDAFDVIFERSSQGAPGLAEAS